MDPLVKLAKDAIEGYIRRGEIIKPPPDLPEEWKIRAGAFVSLKKKGQLRGCIGTIYPATKNLAEEVIRNAIAAATEDPRFMPVTEEELPELTYSVDILSPPEKIKDLNELDPKRYGIIVSSGIRKGVLLPDLEGVDTVAEQLSIALMKAGIREDEEFEVYRFTVRRLK